MLSDACLRRLADALRAALLLGVVVLPLSGHADAAWSMLLVAITALVLRAARAPAAADLIFVALLSLDQWLTGFGAFQSFNRDDTLGHFVLPAAVTPVLAHLAARSGVLAWPRSRRWRDVMATAVGAAALTLALGTVWELVEWSSDAVLGTNMSLGYTDTLRDLAADGAGAVVGAAMLALVLRRRGTGSHDLRPVHSGSGALDAVRALDAGATSGDRAPAA